MIVDISEPGKENGELHMVHENLDIKMVNFRLSWIMLYTVKFLRDRRWKNMKESRKSWRFCQCWCAKLKQSPFSLMYLLFRQNDCHYCKCGILRLVTIWHKRKQKSLHTSQAIFISVTSTPPHPEWDASPSQGRCQQWILPFSRLTATYLEEINWSYQDLNCFSDSLLM